MTNQDIIFTLPPGYINVNDSYIGKEYDYSFYFYVYIQSNTEIIKSFKVYKNGKEYTNCIVNNTSENEYYVKDLDIIKKGNCHYKIEITLNNNRTYRNGFYLKIQDTYIPNDISITHFSTQGFHENFNYLNVLLRVETQYHIDTIKLYRKNKKWIYLGEMEQGLYGYILKDFLFDVTLIKQSYIEYKAMISCSNGLLREIHISVPVYTSTFSLNSINYLGNSQSYTIYGGLVCKIISPLSEYHDTITEFQIDALNKYFHFAISEKNYTFRSEKFSVEYPSVFIKNQTNSNPNIYEVSGEGVIHRIIDKKKNLIRSDQARFYLKLINGNDYSCIFQIAPKHDESLAVYTEETLNNIVRYYDEYTNVQQYDDKTISNDKSNGVMFYDNALDFYDVDQELMQNVPIDILNEYFNSDHITYNYSTFYFLSYYSDRMEITEFDGINTETNVYKHTFYAPSFEYAKSHICFRFDNHDSMIFNLVNYDTSKNLEILTIKDKELSVIVLNDLVSTIFDRMRLDVIYIIKNGYDDIEFDQNYLLKERTFHTMDFYNFTNNVYMFHFVYSVTAGDCIVQYDYVVNFSNDNFSIEKTYYTIITPSDTFTNDIYNQKPMDIMEHLNNNFYIRLSSSLKTKDDSDYGRYLKCSLYESNSLLYQFSPEDFYMEEFSYKDLYQMKVIKYEQTLCAFIQQDTMTLAGYFDLTNNTRKYRLTIPNKLSSQYLLSLNQEQLKQFSNILSIAKQNEFVARTMKIFSFSDKDLLCVMPEDVDMNRIIPFHNTWEIANGFYYDYEIQYPLNIKNKNNFLEEKEIVERV